MTRLIRQGRGINKGARLPLSAFNEAITILRVSATPDPEDESWLRSADRIGNYMALYEPGLVQLVQGEDQSDKELHLFVVHNDEEAVEFALTDYIVKGGEVYHVQGYLHLGGKRGYTQINTRTWGKVADSGFLLTAEENLVETPVPVVDNLFWDDLPPPP